MCQASLCGWDTIAATLTDEIINEIDNQDWFLGVMTLSAWAGTGGGILTTVLRDFYIQEN